MDEKQVAHVVKNLPAVQERWVWSLGREDPWREEWLPTPVFLPGEFHGQRGWWAIVHGVTGNSIQCPVKHQKEYEEEYICITWSLCCRAEMNTTL